MRSEQNIQPEYALVTGVSSGLGRAIAGELAAHGVRVISVCRTKPEISGLERWIQADITQAGDRAKIVSELNALCGGKLDLLVNNAGMGIYAAWDEMKEDDLRAVFELDFFAPVALTQALIPSLSAAHGTVVNISSAAARLWVPCMGAYCAAKAALSMFSNTLRVELRNRHIRVTDVAPGQVNTGFSSRSRGTRKPPDSPGSKGHTPEALARSVYQAWRHGRKRPTYPRILAGAIFFVRTIIPDLYDRISFKLWHLDR